MFGLVIKGLAGIGVGLCFSVARAVYDVVSKRRSIPRVGCCESWPKLDTGSAGNNGIRQV